MRKAFVLYEKDHFHSLNSRSLIGVFMSMKKLLKASKEIIIKDVMENTEKTGNDLDAEIEWNIQFMFRETKKQTQGLYNFELEYEEVECNKILD